MDTSPPEGSAAFPRRTSYAQHGEDLEVLADAPERTTVMERACLVRRRFLSLPFRRLRWLSRRVRGKEGG